MKKILIASGVAVLAVAMIAGAQGYAFNTNLTVGSTGADVVALQTWLMSSGYNIASIANGAAAKGYFGSQTVAAVKAYQTANGVPSTGFVGPLTRGKLNGSAVVANTVSTGCPAGYTCTLATGNTLPDNGVVIPGAPAGITTPGLAGILSASLWSSPSGVSVYKGSAYDVASYKLQAGASDMAVSGFTFDFDNYIWLYANTITLKDEAGVVVGTVGNLNASSFVELTAGSQYRITVPVNGLVVKAAQSKYITVNMGFLSSSDRCPTNSCSLSILGASVRSVDGTGVTDTQTVLTARSFTYQGSNNGQVNVKSDSNQPQTGNVQISTSVNTNQVLLGIFDIKSANVASKLQSLAVNINTNGRVSDMFGTISISAAGQTYSASLLCPAATPNCTTASADATGSTTVAHFTSLVIPLSADVWTPVSVYANVNADTVGAVNGKSASTTLSAIGTAGASTNNPSVIDTSYNTLSVNTATPFSNVLTFTSSGVSQSALAKTIGNVVANQGASSTQTFTFTYTLTAGNNPIYVSSTYASAVTAVNGISGGTVSNVSFRDSDTTGDGTGYYYVDAGNSKTFTITNIVSGTPGAVRGTYSISALKYGTGYSGAITGAGTLSAPTIANTLSADIAF
ncbi:MAG: peptidoglycan-binding domain-containing protein [Candidatus Taylorbacteria bacterium]